MSLTSTEICNRALRKFGSAAIASLKENSQQARDCRLFYDAVRKKLLRAANWNFARKRARLNRVQLLDDDISRYRFNYALPPDCLYVRSVYIETCDGGQWIDFNKKFMGKEFFTDNQNRKLLSCELERAKIEYTADVEDATLFDEEFVSAFVAKLADELCFPLSGKLDKNQELFQRAEKDVAEAVASTLNEEAHGELERSKYLEDYE
jgi:hypothetical protein